MLQQQLTLSTDTEGKTLGLKNPATGTSASSKHSRNIKDDGRASLNGSENGAKAQTGEGRGLKRSPPDGNGAAFPKSKKHKNAYEIKGKIATVEDAARMDERPPMVRLQQALKVQADSNQNIERGESVVYWMRMEDMRIEDNTALRRASEKAKSLGVPLLTLFVISPGDYEWHDRSSRRIDFMLRNLRYVQRQLDNLDIPLVIKSCDKRLAIPRQIIKNVLPSLSSHHLFGNIEYEVDELVRDIKTVELGTENGTEVKMYHDRLAVPPGKIFTKAGKPMSVYSPWQRVWARVLEEEPQHLDMSPLPDANDASIRENAQFSQLFHTQVPDSIAKFECKDADFMAEIWPEGIDAAKEFLDRFLHTKAQKSQFQDTSPLASKVEPDDKKARVQNYTTGRNLVDGDNSSKLSPYLASGVISVRQVLNTVKKLCPGGKLESGRDTGVGMWVQEVAWRDFYNQVMASSPRVSMGRPFQEKYADVQWETSEADLQAWKDGKTGYPIVDAAMRACNARGWMENRVRMVAACFLVKDLMLDWRLGERHFMKSFIDGDLAANNGGWQWVASTGTDPQPYFRIFNSITQSEKCDPDGTYIRHWVPELKNIKGKAIHDPYHHMSSREFAKLGYPAPIVDHKKARERALFRYKHVGEIEE
ncbi:hypothetical protein I350_01299 [Cryptococcus amylolentus CBS 6273]|nr:hypothetical protein I350_01299 [Cryptococcus amylolentus CBS 6273]